MKRRAGEAAAIILLALGGCGDAGTDGNITNAADGSATVAIEPNGLDTGGQDGAMTALDAATGRDADIAYGLPAPIALPEAPPPAADDIPDDVSAPRPAPMSDAPVAEALPSVAEGAPVE